MIVPMQPPELHITTLDCDEGGRLFLWCIRRWVASRFQASDPRPLLTAALRPHRLEKTAADLDGLMTTIAGHARHRLHIGLSGGVELSADEITLVRAVDAVNANTELSDALTGTLVDRSGLPEARGFLQNIAAALRCAGLETGLSLKPQVFSASAVRSPSQPEIFSVGS